MIATLIALAALPALSGPGVPEAWGVLGEAGRGCSVDEQFHSCIQELSPRVYEVNWFYENESRQGGVKGLLYINCNTGFRVSDGPLPARQALQLADLYTKELCGTPQEGEAGV